MQRIIVTAITVLLLVCACNQPSSTVNREALSVTTENDSLKVHRIVLPNDSGVVFIRFEDGESVERIRKDSLQTVTVKFDPGDSTYVRAWLSSTDSFANVRISQIIMPDSTMDGPFGSELRYRLSQRGVYQLLLNENMMSGDPWGGVFMLRVKLSNNNK